MIVVDDRVASYALVDLHEAAVELHHVGLQAPVLTSGEVRGQDAQWIPRVLGLVVEARREYAQLLEDAVDAEHVGDRQRQDAEAVEGFGDGDHLVEPARRRDVA
jgi:hypothetical protein